MFLIVMFCLFFFFYYFLSGGSSSDFPLSDEEYVKIASSTSISKQFLQKFPDANAYVDRSGALAVDYRVDNYREIIQEGTLDYPSTAAYIRLRVFIEPNTNIPFYTMIECRSKKQSDDLYFNLDSYLSNKTCFD